MLDNLKTNLRDAIKKIVKSSGIDEELIKVHCDRFPWVGYHITGRGETAEALLADCAIIEINQDGRTLGCYSFWDAEPHVKEAARKLVEARVNGQEKE